MQIINLTITASDLTTLTASIYKCEPGGVVLSVDDEGVLSATIQTNLEGVKRAAKILNAGKA